MQEKAYLFNDSCWETYTRGCIFRKSNRKIFFTINTNVSAGSSRFFHASIGMVSRVGNHIDKKKISWSSKESDDGIMGVGTIITDKDFHCSRS